MKAISLIIYLFLTLFANYQSLTVATPDLLDLIRVSSEMGMDPEQVWTAGKHPITVTARSLLCDWAVKKLGISATELSKKLAVSLPSVSISVKRGEKIAKTEQLELIKV